LVRNSAPSPLWCSAFLVHRCPTLSSSRLLYGHLRLNRRQNTMESCCGGMHCLTLAAAGHIVWLLLRLNPVSDSCSGYAHYQTVIAVIDTTVFKHTTAFCTWKGALYNVCSTAFGNAKARPLSLVVFACQSFLLHHLSIFRRIASLSIFYID